MRSVSLKLLGLGIPLKWLEFLMSMNEVDFKSLIRSHTRSEPNQIF
jgi:hypothetical protein